MFSCFRSPLSQRHAAAVRSAVLLMALSVATAAAAQDAPLDAPSLSSSPLSEQDPPSISLPQDADIVPDRIAPNEESEGVLPGDRERVRKRIIDALQGRGPAASTTGDPILDDVIGIIRAQGSVLDGTVLGSDALDDAIRDGRGLEAGVFNGGAPLGAGPPVGRSVDGMAVTDVSEQRFRVAESLLRAARVLSALPDPDGHRQSLVRQLRAEAGRCLIGP